MLPIVRTEMQRERCRITPCLLFEELAANRLLDLGWGEASLVHLTGASRDYGDQSMWESIVGTTDVVAGGRFFATRWPKGLPGHDDPPNTLRFPHGLIRFGESLEMCADRLVRRQLGMGVKNVDVAYWDSYVDKDGHWHIEPGCLVEVTGQHKVPRGASEIVTFTLNDVPDLTFWKGDDLREAVESRL